MSGHLLKSGAFKLSSGGTSSYKIDCDALSDDDIKTAAMLIAERIPSFNSVVGVPKGGARLALAMKRYVSSDPAAVPLVVDDVLTTGKSIKAVMEKLGKNAVGAVLFARPGVVVENVFALFVMQGRWQRGQ